MRRPLLIFAFRRARSPKPVFGDGILQDACAARCQRLHQDELGCRACMGISLNHLALLEAASEGLGICFIDGPKPDRITVDHFSAVSYTHLTLPTIYSV